MKRLSLLVPFFVALTPLSAWSFEPGDTLAIVIHGNDRTLAAVEKPAGPVHLNLATTGLFPNEIVIRGSRAYVVSSGSHAIYVYDLPTCAALDTIPTGAGTNPYGMAFVSDTRAYVSLLVPNLVAEIDIPSGMVVATIPVGKSPEGVAYASGQVFVANSGFDFNTFGYDPGTVSVIDPGTNTVTQTLPVGLNPQALSVAPDGEVHVCCTGNYFSVFGRAFMIDPVTTTVVDSLDVGGSPGFLAIDTDGDAYLSDYFLGLLKYDAPTRTVLRGAGDPIPVGTGAAGVSFCDGNAWVTVFGDDQIVILDPSDNPSAVLAMGDGPQDVAFFVSETPIAVRLVSFTAEVSRGDVVLRWRTADEVDHAGFNVYRSDRVEGPWTRVNVNLVAGDIFSDDAKASSERSSVFYRLGAVDRTGREEFFAPLEVVLPLEVTTTRLLPPFPNPLRGSGTIRFHTAAPASITVSVFDVSGREVAQLLNATLEAGDHEIGWDGRSATGRVENGVYFLRLTAGADVVTERVVLSR